MGSIDTVAAEPRQIVLSMDDETRTGLQLAGRELTAAQSFVIDSPTMADEAQQERLRLKGAIKAWSDKYDRYVAPAKKIIEEARADFKPTIDDCQAAYDTIGQKLLGWSEEVKRREEEARRKAEEEARRARAEAEARAAAERARAEERAKEEARKAAEAAEKARREQEEADRIRREAEAKARAEADRIAREKREAEERAKAEADRLRAEGNAKAAAEAEAKARADAEAKAREEKARAEEARKRAEQEAAERTRAAQTAAAEAARREETERATREAGERAAQTTLLAAASQVTAAAAPAPTKIAGFHTADNWVTELDTDKAPTEADAIKLIAAALPQRPELIAMLKLDMVAARRQGTSLKAHFNIPGLKCTNQPKAVSRKG